MNKLLSILFLVVAPLGATTTLTGTLNGPNGVGVNGTLYMSLSQQAALSSGGSCGGPIQVVPGILGPQAGYTIAIKVVNGAMQSPPAIYGNDCLLPGGTYYNVQLVDNNGNTYFTDKWQITGSSIDVGTIVSVVVSGTTNTLGSTGFVSLVPTGTQLINQPPSTYLGINYAAITGILTLPDGSQCTSSGCVASSNNAVLTSGNQTISGIKTFTSGVISTIFNGNVAGCSGSGFETFQNSDGSFQIDCFGHIQAQSLKVNTLQSLSGLTISGTTTFNSTATFNAGVVIAASSLSVSAMANISIFTGASLTITGTMNGTHGQNVGTGDAPVFAGLNTPTTATTTGVGLWNVFATGAGAAIIAQTDVGFGIRGIATTNGGTGLWGQGTGASGYGVLGTGNSGIGVLGQATTGTGISGVASAAGGTGVFGSASGSGSYAGYFMASGSAGGLYTNGTFTYAGPSFTVGDVVCFKTGGILGYAHVSAGAVGTCN